MKKWGFFLALLASASTVAGCSPDALDEDASDGDSLAEEELTAEAEEAVMSENALTPNALTPNALTPNALTPNALTPNALTPNALAALKADTTDGESARMLLKYVVSCALLPIDRSTFSWTGSDGQVHTELYQGALGIAPEWATGALKDDMHKRLVSGCLAARVNYYGQTVLISIRSSVKPLEKQTGSAELTTYKYVEGAFWGNLFAPTPYMNACYDASNAVYSRQKQRECATGHVGIDGTIVPCGIIKLQGCCQSVCQALSADGQYYPSCIDKPEQALSTQTKGVITTALP